MRNVMIPGVLVAVIGVLSSGCQPEAKPRNEETYGVEGKVTFEDGEAVAGVLVAFSSLDSQAHAGAVTDDEGVYRISAVEDAGLPVGNYRVVVAPPPDQQPVSEAIPIDPKYGVKETSGLNMEVEPFVNHYDIVVERAPMSDELLTIYINDHLALLVAETELAERCERSNSQGELGLLLRQLAADLRIERDVVSKLLEGVGGSVSRIKQGMGWLAEKAGRFKLNDRLLQYSDLSRLIELETLWIAAQERRSFWENVQATHAADPRLEHIDFANRRAQAERHCDLLATLRVEAARRAFLPHSAG